MLLTAIFTILTDHLFNEESKFCVIPKRYRHYEHLLDLDKNNVVTDDEIKKAQEILEKAKKKNQKKQQLQYLNNFMLQV